jgi:hypothetical protein
MKDKLTNIENQIREISFQFKTLYAIKILADDNIKELESKVYDLEFNKSKLL